jgi:hemerythrin-like metal-binding protein
MSETINDILADLLAGKERARTGRHLSKLAAFALSHFALEEGIMAATKYPGTALHSLRHQQMMGEIRAFVVRYNRDRLPMNGMALNFVYQWHADHIEREDMSFGLWLSEID